MSSLTSIMMTVEERKVDAKCCTFQEKWPNIIFAIVPSLWRHSDGRSDEKGQSPEQLETYRQTGWVAGTNAFVVSQCREFECRNKQFSQDHILKETYKQILLRESWEPRSWNLTQKEIWETVLLPRSSCSTRQSEIVKVFKVSVCLKEPDTTNSARLYWLPSDIRRFFCWSLSSSTAACAHSAYSCLPRPYILFFNTKAS